MRIVLSFGFALSSVFVWLAAPQDQRAPEVPAIPQTPIAGKEKAEMTHARGSFDVKLTPRPRDDSDKDSNIDRTFIDKQFHGDLEANSKVQMLSAKTEVKDSGAYVAIERVSGSLNGRSGAFLLQHSGTMTRGALQLTITVVPDSGSGQLVGLSGKLDIKIAGGNHTYDFEYVLAENP